MKTVTLNSIKYPELKSPIIQVESSSSYKSDRHYNENGVLQGSLLSPLLITNNFLVIQKIKSPPEIKYR